MIRNTACVTFVVPNSIKVSSEVMRCHNSGLLPNQSFFFYFALSYCTFIRLGAVGKYQARNLVHKKQKKEGGGCYIRHRGATFVLNDRFNERQTLSHSTCTAEILASTL